MTHQADNYSESAPGHEDQYRDTAKETAYETIKDSTAAVERLEERVDRLEEKVERIEDGSQD